MLLSGFSQKSAQNVSMLIDFKNGCDLNNNFALLRKHFLKSAAVASRAHHLVQSSHYHNATAGPITPQIVMTLL